MASAEEYAQWIVSNADKKGTPEFDTVSQAYQLSKQSKPAKTTKPETGGQAFPGVASEAMGAVAEPLIAMGSGFAGKVGGDIAGLGAIPLHAAGITKTEPTDVSRMIQEALTYKPRTQSGASPYNPLNFIPKGIAYPFEKGGEALKNVIAPPKTSGPVQAAFGGGIEELIKQLPMFLGAKAPAAAEGAAGALKSGAKAEMQRALRPSLDEMRKGRIEPAVQAMLDQGLNVSKGGLGKMNERISSLNERIADIIKNSPATVDKNLVASRLQETVDKFQMQVDSASDVAAIQKVWDNFLNNPLIPDAAIPVQTAQKMKQGTNRMLSEKAYGGPEKVADTAAQKRLVRSLKDEIAKVVPEVRPLNAEESKMLTALPMVERRVLREANKNLTGLGLLTTNSGKFAAYLADRSALFHSLVARMLNASSRSVPSMNIAGPALGMGATEQATQPPQGMAPPQ
jgi:hypothetical protein